jgi:putative addiction module component (TIGR02574 family)
MEPNAARLFEEAMKLPPEARAALAGSLIESLDRGVDEGAEAEWEAEIARRLTELDSHQVRSVPWSEARRIISGR